MHFRIRKNVIQLLRIKYDASKKKGVNILIGTVKLGTPELSHELLQLLTVNEVEEFNTWLATKYRSDNLREELAALTLVETLALAERWFEREKDSHVAQIIATDILTQWQSLRRQLTKGVLVD